MPVMTKMRDSMPVVFAVLAGIFLIMIIFQWGGQGTIFSPKGETGVLGTVNGYPITQKDYNKSLDAITSEMKAKDKDSLETLSEKSEAEAEDNAWDQCVSNAIMLQSADKMGIMVTNDEVRDMLFNSPPADIKKALTDSTGHFDQQLYFKELRDPHNDSIVRVMEENARDQIRQMKWQQSMAATVRVTDTEAFLRYMSDSAKAIVQVIKILPQQNPQMGGSVSDQEIQSYYDTHSWLYPQPELRRFKFVRFPLIPNARDTALVMETANTLKSRLAEAPMDKIDTVARELCQDYSDQPFAPRHVITMMELADDTSLMSAKAGYVAVANVSGKITALRVLQVFDTLGDTLFRARHLTVEYPQSVITPTQQEKDSLRAVADQILGQLRAGANFAEIARTRSTDPRTSNKGGDMGWQHLTLYAPYMQEGIRTAKPGDLLGPFESPRGYDIAQLVRSARKAWAVVGVPLQVKPSHQTLDLESQMANIFREQAQKNGFDQTATSSGDHVITDAPPATRKSSPVFGSHLFVDWIFNASKGDISQPFRLVKTGAIIVAQLTDIVPAGPKPFAEVKQQIGQSLALQKAVASLAPRAQQVQTIVASSGDLSAPATTLSDPSLTPVTVLMGPTESVNGLPSAEYVVNNWAFSAQPGSVSPILKGEHGYYIAKLMGRSIPTQKQFADAKLAIVKQITQEREQRLLMEWISNQKEHATIEDFRLRK